MANQIDSTVGGAINIATSSELISAAQRMGYDPVEFDAAYEDRMDELRTQFGESVPPMAYHDGAYGIEPICYVFGASATDAVEQLDRLLEAANVVDGSA